MGASDQAEKVMHRKHQCLRVFLHYVLIKRLIGKDVGGADNTV